MASLVTQFNFFYNADISFELKIVKIAIVF